MNHQRFEENARELEAALALVRKAAQSSALDTESGRGLVDIVSRYAQTFLLLQRYDEGLLTDPALKTAGWGVADASRVRREMITWAGCRAPASERSRTLPIMC